MPKKASTPTQDVDPDKLTRQQAGTYRTADERFEVREANTGAWFLVDTLQTNEFGQELILGPFPTLKAVREAIPGARTVTPMRRPRAKPPKGEPKKMAAPPPPPPSWIDKLPPSEARRVRSIIRALEDRGVEHADSLVRRDREGLEPAIAVQLIEAALNALVEEAPRKDQERARDLVRRAAAIVSSSRPEAGLPGWALVEIGREPEPRNRRIVIDR